MHDNLSCVVWSKLEGYSEVLHKKKAVELAKQLAAKGQQVWVFKLTEFLFYGGLK